MVVKLLNFDGSLARFFDLARTEPPVRAITDGPEVYVREGQTDTFRSVAVCHVAKPGGFFRGYLNATFYGVDSVKPGGELSTPFPINADPLGQDDHTPTTQG